MSYVTHYSPYTFPIHGLMPRIWCGGSPPFNAGGYPPIQCGGVPSRSMRGGILPFNAGAYAARLCYGSPTGFSRKKFIYYWGCPYRNC